MSKKRINIKFRFVIFSVTILLIVSLSISIFSITIIRSHIFDLTKRNLSSTLKYFNVVAINDIKNIVLEYGKLLSENKKLAELIDKEDKKAIYKTFSSYINSKNFDIILIYRKDKIIISNKNLNNDFNYFIEKTLSLNDLSRNTVFIEGDKKLGLFIFSANLVKNEKNQTIGKIVIGFDLLKSKYTEDIKNNFNIDATIYYKNERINTTVNKNGIRQTKTYLDPNISKILLNENKNYSGVSNVVGIKYFSSYLPIIGSNGNPIGILAVGSPVSDIEKDINKVIIFILIFTFFSCLVVIFIAYFWSSKGTAEPVIMVSKALKNISERNLDLSDFKINRKRNDEITDLGNSLLIMVNSIKEYEGKLEYAAYYDNLTKLPNKMLLFRVYGCKNYSIKGQKHCEDMDDNCECFQIIGRLGVILYLNIDNLKIVNNIFGYSTGDLLVVDIAKRIKKTAAKYNYSSFRFTGDEFVLCNNDLVDKNEVEKFVNDILGVMKEPFSIAGNIINTTVSIGISICPENGKNINQLLRNSDIAMQKAKEKGKKHYEFFNSFMEEEFKIKIEMEKELKHSIVKEDFFLNYQPKYCFETNKIDGFEALVRWKDSKNEIISPAVFIPLAEETGSIIRLGEWIIKQSFEFIKNLNIKMNFKYVISINISVSQIIQENFVSYIEDCLKQYIVDPDCIEFEITESILIESFEIVKDKLEYLRNMGFGLALDDFGKGYSSLSYLKLLPISTLKIDKYFIDDILEHKKNSNITEDIIRIGHRMNLKIVAEGVENKKQLELLRKFGCDYIQGYYISKPLQEEELIEILNNS